MVAQFKDFKMSRRFVQPTASVPRRATSPRTGQKVALYYRQSDPSQVGNVSTDAQKIDLKSRLIALGWSETDVEVIDDDAGVSGQLAMSERVGMSRVIHLIESKQIGTVATVEVDRLFRDRHMIEPNRFIQVCKQHDVVVYANDMFYDFLDPVSGAFQVRMFREKAQWAADYLDTYVVGRMAASRHRLGESGFWASGRVPVGYMVDQREKLEAGLKNPAFRTFVPFEPYATIVRAHFEVFQECGGQIRLTMRTLRDRKLTFPVQAAPPGFRANYGLNQSPGGVYLGRSGLIRLLTHPVYIGHWLYRGQLVKRHNHPPIVSESLFYYAFHRLSSVTFEGQPNLQFQPLNRRVRPNLDAKRGVERPLCKGLIGSWIEGRWIGAGAIWDTKNQCYLYTLNVSNEMGADTLWARRCEWVDRQVVARFRQKLEASFLPGVWEAARERVDSDADETPRRIRARLQALNQEIDTLVVNLGRISNQDLFVKAEKRYTELIASRAQMEQDLQAQSERTHHLQRLDDARAQFQQVMLTWSQLPPDSQRNLLALFIEKVEALHFNRSGAMTLHIRWRDGHGDVLELGRKPSRSSFWSLDQRERLAVLLDNNADQLAVAREFPTVQWYQIWHEIKKLRGVVQFTPVYLGKHDTYEAFVARGGNPGRATALIWRADEIERLRTLVDDDQDQATIMRAFPVRRWKHLRQKIKDLYGRLIPIRSSGIPQTLTYAEYVQNESGGVSINMGNADNLETGAWNSLWRRERVHGFP